jgi:hypothetical protein
VSDRRLEALIQEREAEVPVPPFPAHRRKPEAKSGSLRLAVQPMPWQRAAYLEAGRQGGVGAGDSAPASCHTGRRSALRVSWPG